MIIKPEIPKELFLMCLTEVKGLLNSEDRFCRFALARNSGGVKVDETSPTACRWCTSGALSLVVSNIAIDNITRYTQILFSIRDLLNKEAQQLTDYQTIEDVNDFLGYTGAIAVLDSTINNLKGEETND